MTSLASRKPRGIAVISTVVALCVVASAAGAQAVDTVPEARNDAKTALVRELMRTARFREQLVQTIRESGNRQGATLQMPPGFWEKFIERAEQDADSLLAPMEADYARYFSSADLRALIAFYKSPAGQRLSAVAPVISANSSLVGSRWGARVGMELMSTPSPDSAEQARAKANKKP